MTETRATVSAKEKATKEAAVLMDSKLEEIATKFRQELQTESEGRKKDLDDIKSSIAKLTETIATWQSSSVAAPPQPILVTGGKDSGEGASVVGGQLTTSRPLGGWWRLPETAADQRGFAWDGRGSTTGLETEGEGLLGRAGKEEGSILRIKEQKSGQKGTKGAVEEEDGTAGEGEKRLKENGKTNFPRFTNKS